MSYEELEEEKAAAWEKRISETFSRVRHKELRILVEFLYDHQKTRIAQSNRLFIYGKLKLVNTEKFDVYVKSMKNDELMLSRLIKQELQGSKVYNAFLADVKGAGGPLMSGGLIAWIDDISKFETISKLWRQCGYATFEGKAEGRVKGEVLHFNPRLKTHLWKVGNQLLKAKGEYFVLYKQFKKEYESREDIKKMHEEAAAKSKSKTAKLSLAGYKAHIHRMAQRKMTKMFLSHLWTEWRRCEGLPISDPYAIAILRHTNKIEAALRSSHDLV